MNDINQIRAQLRMNSNAILHVWPRFTPQPFDDPRDELLWGWNPNANGGEVVLRLGRYPIHFAARIGDPVMEKATATASLIIIPGPPPPPRMKAWGLTKLGDSVWAVAPSIHLPGAFHGYVVLCDVPNPAPWEVA